MHLYDRPSPITHHPSPIINRLTPKNMQLAFTTPQSVWRHGIRNATCNFLNNLCRPSSASASSSSRPILPSHSYQNPSRFPSIRACSSTVTAQSPTAENNNTSRNDPRQTQKSIANVAPLPLSTDFRTHTCGELGEQNVGETVKLTGWAHAVRDKGGVIFILLRDRYGIIQGTLSEEQEIDQQVVDIAKQVRIEYVIAIEGQVKLRDNSAINAKMSTGHIEVNISKIDILSRTKSLPFMINESQQQSQSEDIKLKYRYLDLRKQSLQNNLIVRHKSTIAIRNYLDQCNFLEVETPILTKTTPEGARDYLIPSRIHKSKFYALPQSPQIYKQLLMVSGFDRYFQITKCFRDEDLRFDRQPEFTQIDLELSFINKSTVMKLAYGIIHSMFKSNNLQHFLPEEFPILTYHQAINRFGVDNPEMRFKMELSDLSTLPIIQNSDFVPIKSAFDNFPPGKGIVKGFVVKNGAKSTSRKVIDGYTAFVKEYGLSGLLYGKVEKNGETLSGPLNKINAEDRKEELIKHMNAEEGDLILVACGHHTKVNTGLGKLRVKIGTEKGLTSEENALSKYAFCWITDFPLFEFDEERNRYISVHHPFTSPLQSQLHLLDDENQYENILSDSYDLVCNGSEIGGGSIRIYQQHIQQKIFHILGINESEQEEKFGFLLDALAYGAPPHGGMAFGLDRCIMIMSQLDSIRDVVAFPKTTSASDLMAGAPAFVSQEQLDELSIQTTASTEDEEATNENT